MTDQILKAVEAPVNENIPPIRSGDTVSVHVKITEGDRERIQEFKGTVIRMRKSGNNANFTVRRIASNGIGVERTFLLRSPRIEKVVVERRAKVRRAQLYFMRERTGKSARLKQKFD
jgi:large subunit ribosomal protein L19